MSKFKTQLEFEAEVSEKFPQIEVLSEYTGSKGEMSFRCKKHDVTFRKTAFNLIHSNHGCNLCWEEHRKSANKKTNDWFASELATILPDIEPMSKYDGMNRKVFVCCKICGKTWKSRAQDLLAGHGCKSCADKRSALNRTMSHDEFISAVNQYNPHKDKFVVLSKYHGTTNDVECKCYDCGYIWKTRAANLIARSGGSGCPLCNQSKGEAITASFLTNAGLSFETQKEFDGLLGLGGYPLSFDFYIPEKNTLIEIHGQQHFEPIPYFGGKKKFEKQQEHDRRKRDYANRNNINLLEIKYLSRKDARQLSNILQTQLLHT